MHRAVGVTLGLALLSLSTGVLAEAVQDAESLHIEAVTILEGASSSSTDPKAYASAMVKLEQAQKLLEQAHAEDSPLGQKVNSALFWARKFSNVQSVSEANRIRSSGGGAVAPVKPTGEADAGALPGMEGGADAAQMAAARQKYEAAEQFAREQAGNDFIVALRWFQVADEVSGTDYSVKALSQARMAQERYSARVEAEKSAASQAAVLTGPEYDLIKEGDQLLAGGKYEEAISKYEASARLKDNMLSHRKLGHALFDHAQVTKDKLLPLFEAAQKEYAAALAGATRTITQARGGRYKKVDWTDARLVAAKRNGQQLTAQAHDALREYDRAYVEFNKVLVMSPGQQDLDAAGHQALCYSVRGDLQSRGKARVMLATFLQQYTPKNDMERTLYEFCKTELKRISTR